MPARAAITQPVRKSPPLIMTGMNGLSSHLRQRMQMRKTRICKRDSFRKKTNSIPRLGHTHNMIYCAAVAATYNAEGNVECWSCSKCGKNFGDSAGTNPLTTVQAAINSANHKTKTTATHILIKLPARSVVGTMARLPITILPLNGRRMKIATGIGARRRAARKSAIAQCILRIMTATQRRDTRSCVRCAVM